ncbi:hypothetical protein NT6N_33620 [Oceaniferula spumae]|uniref:phosphoglycolate phosphatase n=1 Tax=Oceaniferula spumae TaxID=2979115 RepID=A0AAT9FQR2_9BACT
MRLLLFDIDCTLIDTGGAGMLSLKQTATDLYGAEGPELDLAGSTDSGILMGMAEHFGRDICHADFYQAYLKRLIPNLAGFNGRVLPGVIELLDQLQGLEKEGNVTLGLLTGNIAGGAAAKLDHFSLSSYFKFGAYGDDHHDRNQLGPVALQRASQHVGKDFSAEHTIVIGDTPKDIACGKAIGAKTLAVATGSFTVEQLEDHGADVTVSDLTSDNLMRVLLD